MCLIVCVSESAVPAAETPPLSFVQEYIRELGEIERVRASAEASLADADMSTTFTTLINYSTHMQLVLRTSIGMLKPMHLSGQLSKELEDLPAQVIGFHVNRLRMHDRLITIATEMLSGPKPGIDYGKLAAEVPKVRAVLEETDTSAIKFSVLVFATLIDPREDKNGHVSRLSITRAERDGLLKDLQTRFGDQLDAKDQSAIVAAAEVIRHYLRSNYSSADDP